ncbi:hypothetical protein CC78DRAFT_155189 [Lojkania enalia]|uniref:Uncharacterized protein n=1 Tax=Lojkania enalia TaxID=147567 RepID=A0A9P4KD09_9PLEO|nr:hypothetical protein CC78DRAFT_155189 [Didymosphaeria enalia]
MTPDTLPPYRHISSKPVSLSAASTILSTYIANSESHPHLHPDALLTPTGVTFGSHGGPMGGVVMHNLRRVAAGLRGEHLAPEATPEPEDDEQAGAWSREKKRRRRKKNEGVSAAGAEEWQTMSEWEREEDGVEVGEIGPRDTFVGAGHEVDPTVQTIRGDEAEGTEKKRKRGKDDEGEVDKVARAKAKKEKNKARKRAKEEARANKNK